eukprot:TRINITY_DN742_c0_g1_i8.p1 TRINITY_DN742_c0_g1~~TRINITY_DN742_c0_g1_i8.p1  ORF type:complete len:398 (+),score=74.51 TRINITY_DN742_c0_g1_i8:117-1310(+)
MLCISAIKNRGGFPWLGSLTVKQISQSLHIRSSDSVSDKCTPWIKRTFDGVASHEARFRLEQGCFVYDSGMKKEALALIRSTMDSCKNTLTTEQQLKLSPIALLFAEKAILVDKKAAIDLLSYASTFSKNASDIQNVSADDQDTMNLYNAATPTEESMSIFSRFPSTFPTLCQLLSNLGQGAHSYAKTTGSNKWANICMHTRNQNATALLWSNRVAESKELLDESNVFGKSSGADIVLRALAASKLGVTLTKMSLYELAQESFETSLELNKIDPQSFLLPPQPKDMTTMYYRDLYVAVQTLTGLGEKALAEEKAEFAEKYFTFSLKGIENLSALTPQAKPLIAAQAQVHQIQGLDLVLPSPSQSRFSHSCHADCSVRSKTVQLWPQSIAYTLTNIVF